VAVERVNARTIEEALLLTLDGDKATIPTAHERLSRRVIASMHHAIDSGQSPVLLIEEAHALPARALSPLKRIWERTGKGFRQGCAVVLVGQSPELPKLLSLPSVRELRERAMLVDFLPLNAEDREGRKLTDETAGYLSWCLARRGKAARKVIDDRAVSALDAHYRGRLTPLKVRMVMSSCLAAAYTLGQRTVSAEVMHQALGTLPELDAASSSEG
jgi:type II secretory pathway predicted ATPase ExeA